MEEATGEAMEEAMEVDTVSDRLPRAPAEVPGSRRPVDRLAVLKKAMELLRQGLLPFINKSVLALLGEEFAEFFRPQGTSAKELLDYIQQKWLGVFKDTSVGEHKQLIEDLYRSARVVEKLMNPLSEAETRRILVNIESILVAVRASGLASSVADLLKSGADKALAIEKHDKQSGVMEMDVSTVSWLSGIPVPEHTGGAGVLIVLDGSNIAWAHGCGRKFSPRGVVEAYLYFVRRRHPTVIFMPASRLTHSDQRDIRSDEDDEQAMEYLRSLEGTAGLVLTPRGDYDDSYALYFARRNAGLIVSNDRFKDMVHQAAVDGIAAETEWKKWLRMCRVSFSFQGHDFMPNPHYDADRGAKTAQMLKLDSR